MGKGNGKGKGGSSDGEVSQAAVILTLIFAIVDVMTIFGGYKIMTVTGTDEARCVGLQPGSYDASSNFIAAHDNAHGSWRRQRDVEFTSMETANAGRHLTWLGNDDTWTVSASNDDATYAAGGGASNDDYSPGSSAAEAFECYNNLNPPPKKGVQKAIKVLFYMTLVMYLVVLYAIMKLCGCIKDSDDNDDLTQSLEILMMWPQIKLVLWTIPMVVISTMLVSKYGMTLDANDFDFPELFDEDKQRNLLKFAFFGSYGSVLFVGLKEGASCFCKNKQSN